MTNIVLKYLGSRVSNMEFTFFLCTTFFFCSKAPRWLTTFAPSDALILQEEAWNAYPRCKTGD